VENELKSLKVVYDTLKESFQGVVLQLVSTKNNSRWFIMKAIQDGLRAKLLAIREEVQSSQV
jgi:hypothetical protein